MWFKNKKKLSGAQKIGIQFLKVAKKAEGNILDLAIAAEGLWLAVISDDRISIHHAEDSIIRIREVIAERKAKEET